jgi:Ni2+-binding GTPase involved in maturation of urease and hydrogenase
VTKVDIADVVECDRAALTANILNVRPGMEVVEVSSTTGAGMDDWLQFVVSFTARCRDAVREHANVDHS